MVVFDKLNPLRIKSRRTMLWAVLLATAVLVPPATVAADNVSFQGMTRKGKPLTLTGYLTKPEGNGPFPAVVLLHGGWGIWADRDTEWVEKIVDWGYVTLQVDSHGPRGEKGYKKPRKKIRSTERALDAHYGQLYLAGLPYVDGNRIAVLGWSKGGETALFTIEKGVRQKVPGSEPFGAAIAVYPHCPKELAGLETPLLILVGGGDEWAPASKCKKMRLSDTSEEMTLKVYPGATHNFDYSGPTEPDWGIKYDASATSDAYERIKNFLTKHL